MVCWDSQKITGRLQLQPCIVVLAGLPLVGKTTLGKEIESRTNLVFLDVDVARYENGGKGRNSVGQRGSEEEERQAMLEAYQAFLLKFFSLKPQKKQLKEESNNR